MDAGGAEAPRSFTSSAGASFPTLVDGGNRIGAALGARVVPNGLMVAPGGEVLWGKIGGFSVEEPGDVAALDRWLADGTLPPGGLEPADAMRAELIATHMRLAQVLQSQGDGEGAVAELQRALAHDRENFLIRKQIWRLRFPERFYPTIDAAWQREQLAQERAEEAACGPDGCAVPEGGRGAR